MSSRLPTFAKSLLVASFAVIGISGSVFGQARAPAGYKQEQPNPALVEKEKAVLQTVGRILRGTTPFDDRTRVQLNAYFLQYALPKMTIKENWGKLPELREVVLKDLRSVKDRQVFQTAAAIVFGKMRTFADPKQNFHPAVRYNAILLLGELNAVERGARIGDAPPAAYPDPLPAALDILVAEYKNPDPAQIDAVRVAALVGIDRHLKLDLVRPTERRIPPAKKQLIFDEMIALLNASPPAGRSAAGHAWMQRRAIDILAVLGAVSTKPEANAALEKIVADTDAPISLRCTASEALAHWAPTSKAKIDASKVSKDLGLIAVKACNDELERIAALEHQEKEMKQLSELLKKPSPVASGQFGAQPGGGGAPGMGETYGGAESYGVGAQEEAYDSSADMDIYGGAGAEGIYGGMPGVVGVVTPADPRIVWSQRRLKYQLTCVKRGLEGMATAGKANQQEKAVEQVAEAVKAVETALSFTDPPEDKQDLEGLAESIRKGVQALALFSPDAPATGVEPDSVLPVDDLPLGAQAAAVPAADPAELPVDDPALPGLPPVAE